MNNSLRHACYQIHLWGGLSVGLVWIVASLTGAVLAFRSEIDVWLHSGLLRVASGTWRITTDATVAESGFGAV